MASPPALLTLLLSLSLLSIVAHARPGIHFHPCKTLFISYTITSSSVPTLEVSQISSSSDETPSGFFAVYRIIRPSPHYSSFPDLPRPIRFDRPRLSHRAVVPAEPSVGVSSLRERAKDILAVVVGLLFGVGCGVLTSATMYLAWSLFSNRNEICGSDWYDDDSEEDAVESPKKMGYVKVADAAPVKEGYEGN